MAGLDPAIHVFTAPIVCEGVDARHKAGYDEKRVSQETRETKRPAKAGRFSLLFTTR